MPFKTIRSSVIFIAVVCPLAHVVEEFILPTITRMLLDPKSDSEEEEQVLETPNGNHYATKFLRDGIHYTFPDYLCIFSNKKNKITFNLLVDDVMPNSDKVYVDEELKSVNSKFCVIKLVPHTAIHYAFTVQFPDIVQMGKVNLVINPKNVILEVNLIGEQNITWYLCGLIDSTLEKKTLQKHEIKMCDTSVEESSPTNSDGEDAEWPISDL